jgi:hypothetical protein
MKFFTILFLLAGLGFCSPARTQPSYVYIDQVGNNNIIKVQQDGTGHIAGVAIGAYLPTNNNDLKTGYNIGTNPYLGQGVSEFNYVGISQQGPGMHTTKIELTNASNNLISVTQEGSANHTFNITSGANTNNINNTITAIQSGSAQKDFTLNMNGSNGATVTVQQTNPTQTNTGSMTIQCTTCGGYSYIRN